MPKTRLPSICIDEQLPPYVKDYFVADGFRVIRASESRYKGRDEHDYVKEMYARNEVFVTADGEFVQALFDSGFKRHAGVVWLPEQLDYEQRTGFAELAAGAVRVQLREEGPFGMRGLILYPTEDGVTFFDGESDHLVISWTSMLSGPPV